MCDEREEYGTLKQRCYIRWVDVYAERPNFGGLFTFITPRENAPHGQHDVMFGPELGTVFLPGGFVVTRDGEEIWRMSGAKCLLLADCDLDDEQSDAVLQAILTGTEMAFSFVDPHFRRFELVAGRVFGCFQDVSELKQGGIKLSPINQHGLYVMCHCGHVETICVKGLIPVFWGGL